MRATQGPGRTRRRWTDEERREILRALDESGMGVRAFGESIGVHASLLYEWRRRYGTGAKGRPRGDRAERPPREHPGRSDEAGAAFARVVVLDDTREQPEGHPGPADRTALELRHRSGWSILVGAGFDEGILGRVLSLVSSRC